MSDLSQELDAIIAQYLQAIESGEVISREELIGRNLRFADALRVFFSNQDDLQQITIHHPHAKGPAPSPRSEASPGNILNGRYKLIERIGEGGMGTVWVAEQFEPIRRKVAIKLVKAGMDTKQVLARFEAERQALAMMDHPNIAKVFDGGVTDSGRPYFVMEYVKGIPFTEYCDRAKLSLKERLLLFVPVCQAVQHAHHKGIVHRDLKPSNILICLYDGKPVPKVIDFGLAKAMHQPLTDKSIYTSHGMMVGTPLYMSPEQAELNNLDVDTRTDVYSLGVVLYELLTGTTPLERQQLHDAAYNEVLRLIKEVEPTRPSIKLSGSASLPSVAAQRSIDPRDLRRTLAGDLDWIVMKALEKERSRRYETANGLARDIERFLNEEAVEACPPSNIYRLKKLFNKHRGKVIAASLLMVSMLLGIIGTTFGFIESWRAANKLKEANASLTNFSNGMLRVLEHGYAEMQGIHEGNSTYNTPEFDLKAEFKDGEVASSSSSFNYSLESDAVQKKVVHELDDWLVGAIRREKGANRDLEAKSYRVGLQAAYTAIKNGELKSAQLLLDELPERLRGWEWNWLMSETDKTLFQTPIPVECEVKAVSRDGLHCVLKDRSEASTILQVMDATTGKTTATIDLPDAKRILGVAISKDARLCSVCAATELDASKGLRSSLFVWDIKAARVMHRFDSGFDLNEYLFAGGLIECSDSGLQISASCIKEDVLKWRKSVRDFNVMDRYAVFDLDRNEVGPAFKHDTRMAPDGRLLMAYNNIPDKTAYNIAAGVRDILAQQSEMGGNVEVIWESIKSSPDSDKMYVETGGTWSEVSRNGQKTVLGPFDDFSEFGFYGQGKCFVGITDGLLSYSTIKGKETPVVVGAVPDCTIYLDAQGKQCILYCEDEICFYPLPSAREINRLKSLQFTSKHFADNFILLNLYSTNQAELSGINASQLTSDLKIICDSTSLSAVNLGAFGRLLQTPANGSFLSLDESSCFLESCKIIKPNLISEVTRFKVLDTLPWEFHYSNPNREYPASSKASRDGNYYLTVLAPKQSARLFARETGQLVWKKDELGSDVSPLFVDDQYAIFRIDKSLQRFELKTNVSSKFEATSKITAASVSPDGKTIACVVSGKIHLVAYDTMQEIKSWLIPQRGAHSIEWGLEGKRLFVYSSKSTCICDPERGESLLNFAIDKIDDHNLTPKHDLAVFGGRIVSSQPFREHWKQWHATWEREDSQGNRSKSIDYLVRMLGSSQELFDDQSEWKRVKKNEIIDAKELSTIERVHAIQTFEAALSSIAKEQENAKSKVREAWIEESTKHATSELGLEGSMVDVYRGIASALFDCREPLNTRAWNIVKLPGQSTNDYQQGLRLATKAVDLSPSHPVLNTLGVAQFRNALYAEAIVSFENGLSKADQNKPTPTDTLFMAMTHHKLGNSNKARSILADFRSKHTTPAESLDESDQAFLKEAIDLIEPTQTKDSIEY